MRPQKKSAALPRMDLLLDGISADDDRAALPEQELAAEEDAQAAAVSEATVGPSDTDVTREFFEREQNLLDTMTEIAETSRALPDARVKKLIEWIREHMCPGLPAAGAKWNDMSNRPGWSFPFQRLSMRAPMGTGTFLRTTGAFSIRCPRNATANRYRRSPTSRSSRARCSAGPRKTSTARLAHLAFLKRWKHSFPRTARRFVPPYALHNFQPTDPTREWILLIEVLPKGTDLDTVAVMEAHQWQASPQARFERLLRETGIPIGLLVNGRQIRLVYDPRIESSGYITFNLADMVRVAGRPIFAALHELLYSDRMFGDEKERLPAISGEQSQISECRVHAACGQVLEALYELLRGFQAANDQTNGELLRDILARDPNLVHAGLLTALLRLVFLLYSEDRGLASTDPVYANFYSVTGLSERLRADTGRYPDTMYQRYGAWAQRLALFRLIYEGGSHGVMRIPPREGYLFDPDRYPFLEGRQQRSDEPAIPRVSDGILYHVLSKLMVLNGERLSYRTLGV